MRRSALLLTALIAVLAAAGVLLLPGAVTPPRAPNCAFRTQAFFWTGSGWMGLARALAANRSPCAEYWISIPPPAADKRGIRADEDDRVRALGIHPVAELTIGGATGWANWVNEPGANRTWFDAGVEFRRAMEREGYDVDGDETWLINEFDRTTARDGPRQPPDQDWGPVRRRDMRELMRGLYRGAEGMLPAAGIAEIGIHFRHQNIPDVDSYRSDMQGWLADSGFWNDADRFLRWIAVENYPDSRLWAPPGSALEARARHLEAYVFHLLELVRSGPPTTRAARSFLERKFLPLVNAGWRARGGEQFEFVTGHGNTILNDVQMRHFVTEQVYSIRRYAGLHRGQAPAGRLGFSWQACNRLTATEPDCRAQDAAFKRSLDLILTRIARAIRFAYGEDRSSAARACTPPGGATDWCRGRVRGASFTRAWDDFTWRP
jgi:hypothetical protein